MRARLMAFTAAVVMGLVLTAFAADKPDADKPGAEDRKALQGTWQTVSSEMDGEKQPEENVKPYTVVFSGDKLLINRDGEAIMKGAYTLDTAKSPGHIDYKLEENVANPNDVGKTLPGVYEIKGDALKWCFTLPEGDGRPKEFKSEAGSNRINATLKREKK